MSNVIYPEQWHKPKEPDYEVIGTVPEGTVILDMTFFGGELVLLTEQGVMMLEGKEFRLVTTGPP